MESSAGGLGKAASEMMKEMQEAQQQAQKAQDLKPGGPNEAFQAQMQQVQQAHQAQQIQPTHQVNQATAAVNVLQQAKNAQALPSTKVGAAAKAKNSQMVDMLQGLIGGQDKMAAIMKSALSGQKMGPQELLAMQAGVYRFSQELELTSKVVEKATSGIKQTMNTQV